MGKTAADDDLQFGSTVLLRLEVSQRAVQLVVGILTDAAGVEHHDVGLAHLGGRFQPIGLKHACDPLRVVLVHLTPKGAYQVFPSHLPMLTVRPHVEPRLYFCKHRRRLSRHDETTGSLGGPGMYGREPVPSPIHRSSHS